MPIPQDYAERVYAGVLGKIIGVYLGRPFEQWSHEKIMAELGEIWYYVHEKRGVPLVVTDDDISGTFTFLRALSDYDNTPDLTPEQIGQTWLNYIIEKRAILWWGGMGNSTEHTAFLRLKAGIPAPRSGSMALNGQVVVEQIGAQIFIDGWGMVCPGDPERAADFARRAASVSHDGEAIYGAQVVAAMEAQAFVESDINKLLDMAVGLVPSDSVIYRLIAEIREWHSAESDWRKTRALIAAKYGYDKWGGGCHIVPNHALIVHALLHGEGDFQKSLMIVNTCGWDTDCNSANVGCLLGIRGGLSSIDDGPDWRGPVADRMYLPTADGGRCITDAVQETYRIVNIGRVLQREPPLAPKNGARFHFTLPGSVQGFQVETGPDVSNTVRLYNIPVRQQVPYRKYVNEMRVHYQHVAPGQPARFATPTFIMPDALKMGGYAMIACPTLYPGQTVRAHVSARGAEHQPITCRLYTQYYNELDNLVTVYGAEQVVEFCQEYDLSYRVAENSGCPIGKVGVELSSPQYTHGDFTLDYLTWDGTPNFTLTSPQSKMERQQWVNGVDQFEESDTSFRIIQNAGTGLLIHGTRDWTDYTVSAAITPHLIKSGGLAARVQGLRRYYALLLCGDDTVRLVKALDGETVLAQSHFPLDLDMQYELSLRVAGDHLQASIDGNILFDLRDPVRPLFDGAVAFVCDEGRLDAEWIRVA